MEYLKRIFTFVKPYKRYGYLNIFFNILYAIFSGLSFFATIPLLSVIFNPEKGLTKKPVFKSIYSIADFINDYVIYKATILSKDNAYGMLLVVIGVIIAIFLLKNIFSYLAVFNITLLKNNILIDLRNQMYKKITELPVSFFSKNKKGDTIARTIGDIFMVQESYLSALELIVREPLTILFTFIYMLATSVKLTLFALIFIPIAGLVISKIGKSLKKHSDNVQKEQGEFLSILEESLSGSKVIKGFNAEEYFQEKFNKSTSKYLSFINILDNRVNLSSPLSEFLGIVIFSVLLLFGGKMVLIDKTFSGEKFLGLIFMAYNILTPAKNISKVSYGLKKGKAAADRVFEILDYTDTIKDDKNASSKNDFTTNITFDNIGFKYEEDFILENFSLKIPKGKTIALVGQSGSGKSTIANLITRFYDIQKGEIKIDGINIQKVTKRSLRNLIGIVTQDAILFNDTIKQNLLLGKEDATENEIIEALKVANAWEFVKDLPDGIYSNIGESGNKLSGGQKQRLSIARAVLKNPPIMILDEATSALDTESEKLVQIALENMMRNRTSIVIAHRLSTIQNADTIIVMQRGTIIEHGNHQELLAKNGTYRKLVEMQQL